MMSDPEGGKNYSDPISILIEPGQRVRWKCVGNVHTTTTYRPKNMDHSLYIPEAARLAENPQEAPEFSGVPNYNNLSERSMSK